MKVHNLPTSIDISKSILWQYNNAERLKEIIYMIQEATNASSVELWKKMFYAFDLDKEITPSMPDYKFHTYGLESISALFGVNRPFWRDGDQFISSSLNTWRRYLKGMIWLMDSDGSVNDINKWLSLIFPGIKAYVRDYYNMTIRYEFYPFPVRGSEEYELIHIDNFLPHPAGVKAFIKYINDDAILGLDNQNLGQLNYSRMNGGDN
jgi:hypothetical protein